MKKVDYLGQGLGIAAALGASAVPLRAAEGGLFAVDPGLAVWTVVVFLLLLGLLQKFAWGPMLGALSQREDRIQGQLDDAARAQADARLLLEEHRAELNEARREARRIVDEAKASGDVVRRQIEERARDDAQRTVESARREIERERDAALDTIRREAVELALAATARLLDQKLDAGGDRELIEGYVTELGSAAAKGVEA